MSIPPRAATWGEIEAFCRVDGWVETGTTDHVFWQKTLESGEVLETHRSLAADKTMSQGRFGSVLRTQLRVTRREFWEALQTGKPVDRPSKGGDDVAPTHEAWVVIGLQKFGVSDAEIEALTPDQARSLLYEKWAE